MKKRLPLIMILIFVLLFCSCGKENKKADISLKNFEDIGVQAEKYAVEVGLAESGDNLIITAGVPFSKQGNTNTLHIITVK